MVVAGGGGSAGRVRSAHSPVSRAVPAAVHTAPRHPMPPATAASGNPAANAPSWTPDCFVPVTEPRRAGGTDARMALFVAGLASAWGTPPSATAASSRPAPGAAPMRASATADTTSRTTSARRGPIRSTMRPPIGDSTAAVPNPIVVVRPSTVGDIPSSSTSRGPSAPSRNNWSIEKAMAQVSSAVSAGACRLSGSGADAVAAVPSAATVSPFPPLTVPDPPHQESDSPTPRFPGVVVAWATHPARDEGARGEFRTDGCPATRGNARMSPP